MPIIDHSKKIFINDRNDNTYIGIDLPFRKSSGQEGYFASTSFTIDAVKNNIRNLLKTKKGERLMQPNLGLNLDKFLFENFTDDTLLAIQNEILNTINTWLPFVEVKDLNVEMAELSDLGNNRLNVTVLFNITRDSNTLDSVNVTI
jgi:phage baseplate assembly protein W